MDNKIFHTLSFTEEVNEFFKVTALDSDFILEYGSGASTYFLAQNFKKCMTVESDSDFLINLMTEISINIGENKIIPIHINLGKTKHWGYPVDDLMYKNFPSYSILPWKIIAKNYLQPDLVLIDGRFRVSSMLATLSYITKDTKILFDDYIDRPYKDIIEKIIKPQATIGRAAYFEATPNSITTSELLNLYQSFFDAG